jgi:hypothetical protein
MLDKVKVLLYLMLISLYTFIKSIFLQAQIKLN